MNWLFVRAGRILVKVIVLGALGAAGVAWAEADRAGALAVGRQAGGTSGGVVEVRVNGAVWGLLYEGDRVAQNLTPGALSRGRPLAQPGGRLGRLRCPSPGAAGERRCRVTPGDHPFPGAGDARAGA